MHCILLLSYFIGCYFQVIGIIFLDIIFLVQCINVSHLVNTAKHTRKCYLRNTDIKPKRITVNYVIAMDEI